MVFVNFLFFFNLCVFFIEFSLVLIDRSRVFIVFLHGFHCSPDSWQAIGLLTSLRWGSPEGAVQTAVAKSGKGAVQGAVQTAVAKSGKGAVQGAVQGCPDCGGEV